MKFVTHPEADREIDAAADYYESEQAGLGRRFLVALRLGYDQILENPRLYPLAEDAPDGVDCRNKGRLGRFPFRIVYTVLVAEILIVAVAHHRQRPGYWHDRVTE